MTPEERAEELVEHAFGVLSKLLAEQIREAVHAERERCAKLADEFAVGVQPRSVAFARDYAGPRNAAELAARIREGGGG